MKEVTKLIMHMDANLEPGIYFFFPDFKGRGTGENIELRTETIESLLERKIDTRIMLDGLITFSDNLNSTFASIREDMEDLYKEIKELKQK